MKSVSKYDSKSMYGGTKTTVSVPDERVQANQDRVYFFVQFVHL